MSSQGPNSGGTFATVGGGVARTNPGNAAADDGSLATINLIAGGDSQQLRATNFGFSIPTGNNIDGIQVDVKWDDSTGNSVDISAILVVSGAEVGFSFANGVNQSSLAYLTYGGPTSTWGAGLTVANINDSTFGFDFGVENQGGTTGFPEVDHIRITVYYSAPPTTAIRMEHKGF